MNAAMVQAHLETTSGLESYTVKLEIASGTIYFRYGFIDKRLCYVDFTISSLDVRSKVDPTRELVQAQTTKLDNNKALIELVCREASDLLQYGIWDITTLVRSWRGTHFEPAGFCKQVHGFVSSPLDAAVRWLEKKGYMTNE